MAKTARHLKFAPVVLGVGVILLRLAEEGVAFPHSGIPIQGPAFSNSHVVDR